MPSTLSALTPAVLSLLILGCQDNTTRNRLAPPQPHQEAVPAINETKIPATGDLDRITKIATASNIVADHGGSFIYIDGPPKGEIVVVHETLSSRTKYKTITPIIYIDHNDLIIDCSYVRSIEDMTVVSVGTYCRGRTAASSESIEDAVGDEHLITYSASLPWLGEAGDAISCESPTGLAYAKYYIVRCQSSETDETTENLSITVLSSDYRVNFSITGYEFAPSAIQDNEGQFIFWGLSENSHHKVVVRTAP